MTQPHVPATRIISYYANNGHISDLIQKSVKMLVILHVIAGKSIYVQTIIHTGLL